MLDLGQSSVPLCSDASTWSDNKIFPMIPSRIVARKVAGKKTAAITVSIEIKFMLSKKFPILSKVQIFLCTLSLLLHLLAL